MQGTRRRLLQESRIAPTRTIKIRAVVQDITDGIGDVAGTVASGPVGRGNRNLSQQSLRRKCANSHHDTEYLFFHRYVFVWFTSGHIPRVTFPYVSGER